MPVPSLTALSALGHGWCELSAARALWCNAEHRCDGLWVRARRPVAAGPARTRGREARGARCPSARGLPGLLSGWSTRAGGGSSTIPSSRPTDPAPVAMHQPSSLAHGATPPIGAVLGHAAATLVVASRAIRGTIWLLTARLCCGRTPPHTTPPSRPPCCACGWMDTP